MNKEGNNKGFWIFVAVFIVVFFAVSSYAYFGGGTSTNQGIRLKSDCEIFGGAPSSCTPGDNFCYTNTNGGHACSCQNGGAWGPVVSCSSFSQECSCEGSGCRCHYEDGN